VIAKKWLLIHGVTRSHPVNKQTDAAFKRLFEQTVEVCSLLSKFEQTQNKDS